MSEDSINELRKLVYELLNDVCFRNKAYPHPFTLDNQFNKAFENTELYIQSLKDTIRKYYDKYGWIE